MKSKVTIEWLNGKVERVILAESFSPRNALLEILDSSGDNPRTIPLTDLCAIRFPPPTPKKTLQQPADKVTTIGGHYYRVIPISKGQFENGFYAFTLKDDTVDSTIFFTSGGIKKRSQEKQIGTILSEKGTVSEKKLDAVIQEQKKLRKKNIGELLIEQGDISKEVIETALQKAKATASAGEDKGSVKKPLRVGEILVEAGIVSEEQVSQALKAQSKNRSKKIGTLLIEKGFVTEDQLLGALATKFHLNYIDLDLITPSTEAIESLPLNLVEKLLVLPIKTDSKTITIATSDPTDLSIDDAVRFHTRKTVKQVVMSDLQIKEGIKQYYQAPAGSGRLEEIISGMVEETQDFKISQQESLHYLKEDDDSIIGLVQNILLEIYREGGSDIHIEPGRERAPTIIRYRIDGVCKVFHRVPANYRAAIVARIKILAGLDISERRRPQSGKILLKTKEGRIEYRVEITPTVGGVEDAVLRLLSSSKPFLIDDMGFSQHNLEEFEPLLHRSHGIILCVGPTGSGKTTTLHSAIAHINNPERKIWTVEDPVEITQNGLRQVQVNNKIGFTFQEALRSFLRADPDVIMVGEMRDSETAKIAIEASLTGHLVFSTLHTNSAPETAVRLIEMGMEPLNFADACLAILAQRLARKLCSCQETYHPDENEYNELKIAFGEPWFIAHRMPGYDESLTLKRAKGCKLCDGKGYKGRMAIHELMVGSEAVKVGIKKGLTSEELRDIALRDGMRTLRMDGIAKVFKGLTSFEEIKRVCF